MRRILAAVGALFAAAAEAQSISHEVSASAPQAFTSATILLSDLGFAMKFADRESGILTTDDFLVRSGKKFLDKGMGHWLDCGKDLGLSRAVTADLIRLRISINVQPVAADSGKATVRFTVSGLAFEERTAISAKETSCTSRDRLELLLVDSLRSRLPAL